VINSLFNSVFERFKEALKVKKFSQAGINIGKVFCECVVLRLVYHLRARVEAGLKKMKASFKLIF